MHSKFINDVLRPKVSHDRIFCVFQDDTNCSFKTGRSSFKYKQKHVFVDGKKYKVTPGMWELLTKSKPNRNLVSVQDKKAQKQILLQPNAHRFNYRPSDKIKANKRLKYTHFISQLGNRCNINNVFG